MDNSNSNSNSNSRDPSDYGLFNNFANESMKEMGLDKIEITAENWRILSDLASYAMGGLADRAAVAEEDPFGPPASELLKKAYTLGFWKATIHDSVGEKKGR